MNHRFDERDNVFARHDLIPGSPEYEEMYQRHPEWKDIDDYIRSLPGEGAFMSPADFPMLESLLGFLQRIGAPEYVDGEPEAEKVSLSPEDAALKIKAFARHLGADLVGISLLKQDYVFTHRGRLKYPESEPWGRAIENQHKFAVSLGFRENLKSIRTAPHSAELLESILTYMKSAVVSVILTSYIRGLGYPARAHHFRNYQVLSVPLAVEAGLGELGRCGFLVTKEHGNCLRLATVTTDLPLVSDKPVDIGMQDFCEHCKLCADACPSGAIPTGGKISLRGVEKWQIDEFKCYQFWGKIGSDCGMCIASCPWSEPQNLLHRTAADLASRSKLARRLLLWIYPLIYGKYQPRNNPDWLDKDKLRHGKDEK